MSDSLPKHIALLDIRRRHQHKNRPPGAALRPSRPTRQTLGEDKRSLMARLTPSMLGILNKVNTVAGLGGAKAHRCFLKVKLFVVAQIILGFAPNA